MSTVIVHQPASQRRRPETKTIVRHWLTVVVVTLIVAAVLMPAAFNAWHTSFDNVCHSHGSFGFKVEQPDLGSALDAAYVSHGLHYSGDKTPLENATMKLNHMSDSTVRYNMRLQVPICKQP